MGYRYALAGNPNCGKTTLFNAVTGSNQYVGNWPGVTVEKKEGKITHDNMDASIVDLPGIYSLSPYSMEEIVTRNYIIDEKPDLIINIVDATNLERNLYLSLQLAELGIPMVIALNMIDMVEKNGDSIDVDMLSVLLGIRVVPISAAKGTGIHKLLHAANHEAVHGSDTAGRHMDKHNNMCAPPDIYTGLVRKAVLRIEELIADDCKKKGLPLRWSAVKLIEGDEPTLETLALDDTKLSCIESIVSELETKNIDREMVIADQKYKYICAITDKCVKRAHEAGHLTLSDKIDRVVTNKYLAIPLFFGLMLLIFYITFGALGANLTDLVDKLINEIFASWVRGGLVSLGASDWAVGLVCDGIIGGVGAVLSFFPQILLLFLFLSILEDSGYMSRAAFIMDRALHSIGLSGKSFVPMIMGFGCSVPAIMATRTLENEKDRRITMMLIPFMSCSAKMPVYSMFILAFFPSNRGLVVGSLYLLGMLVAILSAFILQKTVLKGGHAPFVMELPPYRLPTAKTLGLHLYDRIKDFMTKAGTVLLGASVVIWFCQYFNFSLQHVENSEESILGVIGSFVAPIFAPLGFGDWKSSVSMISGLIARESIVSTMGILHGAGDSGAISDIIASVYTPAAAYSFMTFCLLFIPCMAAVATLRREMNSRKWTAIALGFQAVTAWVITFIVYNICKVVM
ncbi:MAG TPA: ferrous iron transport protein B [Candidatus Fimenecus excrementavium]|nr:ferrous iron transport protein B [Candidatus Fimenecus excrementavium]